MDYSRGYHRMRVAKACRSCRQRKVKCVKSSEGNKCKACHRRGSECIMSDEDRGRRRSSSKHTWVSWPGPEAPLQGLSFAPPMRLPSSEGALTSQNQPIPLGYQPEQNVFLDSFVRDPFLAPEAGCIHPAQSIPDGRSMAGVAVDDVTGGQDMLFSSPCFALPRCLLDPSATGYSSLFNLLTPEGLHWIGEKVGREVVNQSALLGQTDQWDEDAMYVGPLSDALRTTPFLPLPPKYIAVRLLDSYFKTVNPFCPLFDEDDFMTRFEEQYPVQPQASPAWWACINATLALACTLEDEFAPNAWMYWKNCTLSLDGFFIQKPQLLSAQALLAMTLYLHGTFSTKPSDSLVSFAIRILHGLSFAEEQSQKSVDVYKRILTLCYAQDIEYSLRCGTPPTRTLEIPLYFDLADGTIPPNLSESVTGFNVYSSFCGLTTIKTQVYHSLYSTVGSDKSDTEVIAAVGQLDGELQDWKNDIPDEYRPESTHADSGIRKDPHLGVLYLHFSYYHCLLIIHRRGIAPTTWKMELDPARSQYAPSNPRALRSRQLCVAAARMSLDLVKYIPANHALCAGIVVSFVMFALMTLSTLIVEEPHIATVKADLERMSNVESFFSTMAASKSDREAIGVVQYCMHHRGLAEQAIQQSLRARMTLKRPR